MTKAWTAYLEATEKCAAQCEAMAEQEQEKRQALLDGDTARLEGVIQAQQAGVMALETLERKRLDAQEAAGFPREADGDRVLAALEEGTERAAFTALLERLRRSSGELRESNRSSLEIAQRYLQLLSRAAGSSEAGPPTYAPGRRPGPGWSGGTSFEQKI